MSTFGRCCICTTSFTIGDVATLKCGHTYHNECIRHWIQTSRTCPNCRKKSIIRDIVKLYFDEADMSFTQQPASNVDNDRLIEDLTLKLTKATESNQKLLHTFDDFKNQIRILKSQLEYEKNRASTLPVKEERIRHLEGLLKDQAEIQQQLDVAQNRIRACEFFSYLKKRSGRNEEGVIDEFLQKSGDIDASKFINLIEGQNKKLANRVRTLESELGVLRRCGAEKEETIRRYKKLIEELKQQSDMLSTRLALAEDKAQSVESEEPRPQAKKSFGFSFMDDDDLDVDVIPSAQRPPPPKHHMVASVDSDDGQDFKDVDDDDEDEGDALIKKIFGEEDVPMASSVIDGAVAKKRSIPKRPLHSTNFRKSICILDELELKGRESVRNAGPDDQPTTSAKSTPVASNNNNKAKSKTSHAVSKQQQQQQLAQISFVRADKQPLKAKENNAKKRSSVGKKSRRQGGKLAAPLDWSTDDDENEENVSPVRVTAHVRHRTMASSATRKRPIVEVINLD